MRSSLGVAGLLLLSAAPAAAQAVVVERILAVVEGRPVLFSEARLVRALQGVGLAAATDALVDERLMFREASRLPQAQVTDEEVARAVASLRPRAPEGTPEEDLARLARRQATILKYVEFRFRPQVRVTEEQVRFAYDVEAADGGAAPYAERAPLLRRRLEDAEVSRLIEAWVKDLRASAAIQRLE